MKKITNIFIFATVVFPHMSAMNNNVALNFERSDNGVWDQMATYYRSYKPVPNELINKAVDYEVTPNPYQFFERCKQRKCCLRVFGSRPRCPDLQSYADNLQGIPEYVPDTIRKKIQDRWLNRAKNYSIINSEHLYISSFDKHCMFHFIWISTLTAATFYTAVTITLFRCGPMY